MNHKSSKCPLEERTKRVLSKVHKKCKIENEKRREWYGSKNEN